MHLRDVAAPAKINLFLHVVGRRADGYHLLQTAFRFISLQDTLHFERLPEGRIERATDLPGTPPEADLTVRAARALQAATGTPWGARIAVEKRIPMGGGLGGGSSDAASTLLALNRLWNTGLSRQQLMQLALPLGADVPVFVFGHNAFAEGVGEQLAALDLPPRWYVVIQPRASVPTAAIFGAQELTRDSKPLIMSDFTASFTADSKKNASEVNAGSSGSSCRLFGRNDLESVVFDRYDIVQAAVLAVRQVIAGSKHSTCSDVRMSGSGACLFVECVSQQQAAGIQAEITAKMMFATDVIQSVHTCTGLDRHPLQSWVSQ